MRYKNIAGSFFGLVTKHACDRRTDRRTEGQTDGQNYDFQDRASIAASRGKNGSPYMLSIDRCLSCLSCPVSVCLSVCNVGVLWPNGSMDEDVTWYGGRPRPRPHCVKWGPSYPSKGAQQRTHFSIHVYCGQTVAHLSNC